MVTSQINKKIEHLRKKFEQLHTHINLYCVTEQQVVWFALLFCPIPICILTVAYLPMGLDTQLYCIFYCVTLYGSGYSAVLIMCQTQMKTKITLSRVPVQLLCIFCWNFRYWSLTEAFITKCNNYHCRWHVIHNQHLNVTKQYN